MIPAMKLVVILGLLFFFAHLFVFVCCAAVLRRIHFTFHSAIGSDNIPKKFNTLEGGELNRESHQY